MRKRACEIERKIQQGGGRVNDFPEVVNPKVKDASGTHPLPLGGTDLMSQQGKARLARCN
jgi:hypothetical protein